MKLHVKDIISDTVTNSSGFVLLTTLDNFLRNGEQVELSFDGTPGLSSSFLNSSFGELIEKHGFNKIKSFIKITGLSQTQANYFKRYLNTCGIQI